MRDTTNNSDRRYSRHDRYWIADFIDQFLVENRYAPTIREVGEFIGVSSSSSALRHLQVLQEWGWVDWVPGQERTIHVTDVFKELVREDLLE